MIYIVAGFSEYAILYKNEYQVYYDIILIVDYAPRE